MARRGWGHAAPCFCDTVPSGRPSPRDSYQEGEARVPHPHCPRHREEDGDMDYDYDSFAAEFYELEWCEDDQEWKDS